MTLSSEARLTGADRADISDLYGRYALAIDFGDGTGWAECFTTHGTFTAHRGEGVQPLHVTGREELDRFAREHRAGPRAGTRHHFTSLATRPVLGGAVGARRSSTSRERLFSAVASTKMTSSRRQAPGCSRAASSPMIAFGHD